MVKMFHFEDDKYVAMEYPVAKNKVNKIIFIVYEHTLLPCFKTKYNVNQGFRIRDSSYPELGMTR